MRLQGRDLRGAVGVVEAVVIAGLAVVPRRAPGAGVVPHALVVRAPAGRRHCCEQGPRSLYMMGLLTHDGVNLYVKLQIYTTQIESRQRGGIVVSRSEG